MFFNSIATWDNVFILSYFVECMFSCSFPLVLVLKIFTSFIYQKYFWNTLIWAKTYYFIPHHFPTFLISSLFYRVWNLEIAYFFPFFIFIGRNIYPCINVPFSSRDNFLKCCFSFKLSISKVCLFLEILIYECPIYQVVLCTGLQKVATVGIAGTEKQ